MSNTSLMQLANEFQELLALIESSDEEDQQMLTDTLDEVAAQLAAKIDGYVSVMKRGSNDADLLEKESKRLAAAAKAIRNNVSKMNDTAMLAMEKLGTKELKGEFHKLKIVGKGGIAPLEITGTVPDNFKKVTIEDDKAKIRKALENGEELSFAHLGERGTYVKVD